MSEKVSELSMLEAINETLHSEMARDERIVVLGEDVGRNGGVFRATEGLIEKFGENSASLATNMVHVNQSNAKYTEFVAHLRDHEVIVGSPRFVFHMGISESDLDRFIELISSFKLR